MASVYPGPELRSQISLVWHAASGHEYMIVPRKQNALSSPSSFFCPSRPDVIASVCPFLSPSYPESSLKKKQRYCARCQVSKLLQVGSWALLAHEQRELYIFGGLPLEPLTFYFILLADLLRIPPPPPQSKTQKKKKTWRGAKKPSLYSFSLYLYCYLFFI